MKVALETSALKSGHQHRGIGFYTRSLIEALKLLGEEKISLATFESGQIPADCDLVHYPFFDFFFLSLPLVKRKPIVVTIHDCTPLVFPKHYPPGVKGKFKFLIQNNSLSGVKRVITDSENSKKDIVKFLKYPSEKIDVVYLAPVNKVKKVEEKAELERITRKYKLPKDFVLYVGDVNYNKNLPGLIKACRLTKIPLVIVGKQATQKKFERKNIENEPLLQLIKLVENRKDVLRLGFVEEKELASLYTLASCYCQPSFYEGFGIQILEAMSCGCPVITSNLSSLPEVAGKAAILVDPYKVEEIAKAIRAVSVNKNLADKLRKAGSLQVEKFSWGETARKTIASYKKALV